MHSQSKSHIIISQLEPYLTKSFLKTKYAILLFPSSIAPFYAQPIEAISINTQILNRIPGEKRLYSSVDSIEDDLNAEESENFTLEFLNSLTPSGMPTHNIFLKQGAFAMLLRISIPTKVCPMVSVLSSNVCLTSSLT